MDNDQIKLENRNRKFAYISLFTGMLPIILFIYCLLLSRADVKGTSWLLLIAYYLTIGIPLSIVSIAFAILGLKSKRKMVSIMSLIISLLPVIAYISIMVTGYVSVLNY